MNFSFKTRGFTLIELLVVISIIGLLSSVVLSALQDTRKKAEDKNKLSTMLEYRKAILLAYDANGEYPDPGSVAWYCLGDTVCTWGASNFPENITINGILDDYIALPKLNPILNTSNVTYEGPIYRCFTRSSDGVCTASWLQWVTTSSGSCGSARQVYLGAGILMCRFELQ